MRRLALLLAWQPSFSKDLSELESLPRRAPAEKQRRQPLPLSLQAREELSRKSNELRYHVVTQDWFGQRVDDFITQHHPEWDYETVKRLVQQGHIYRYRKNGKRRYTRLTDRLEFDELVVVPTASFWERQLTPPSGVELQSSSTSQQQQRQKFHLSAKAREMAQEMVLFKNEHVIVINKPSGVPIMPTRDPLAMNITDLLPAWRYTNTQKPIICHNLDTETSGCVVLARSANAHRMLGRMFVKRVVPNSVYWGFSVGKPPVNVGRIRMHFEIQKGHGGDIIVARPTPTAESKVGIAEFVVNASVLEFGSFISFYPLTTRRHQERIMAAHALRAPLLGDAKYGGESAFPHSLSLFWDPSRRDVPLHLHHRKIQLPYKNGAGAFVCVTAPLPSHMEKTFKRLGWPVDADDPLIPG
ncbi:pseudouridylate synthase-like protein [Leishmania tarentolae]|uniref:Pseudouridylate synthase RPUSD4, mitochondrial n=1 Tax=Leishmania tarentolae TaxID=5689 RepID=A0A640K7I0_LEITA|nr:pseudouridylate synthase-like protein [Leishmania tarentolae]